MLRPNHDPLLGLPLAPDLDREEFQRLLERRAERLSVNERGEATEGEPILLLNLAGERFALPLVAVREIDEAVRLTPLPGVPSFVAGLRSRRGRAHAVIDLARYLELEGNVGRARHVLVTGAGIDVYLLADGEVDVSRLEGRLEPPCSSWNRRRRRSCQGIAPGLVSVLDPARLLADLRRETGGADKPSNSGHQEG